MDRAIKIRRVIKTVIADFSPFSKTPDYDTHAVIGREQAALISESVFEALDQGGCLSKGPAIDRRCRITLVITEAIGNIGEHPGNHMPGQWWSHSRRPGWDMDEVAASIYANLAHAGYISEEVPG